MRTVKRTNHWNFRLKPEHKENYEGVKSLTVPDETMTIREILERHKRGMPLDPRNVQYSDSDSFDDLDMNEVVNMDFAERDELKQQLRSQTSALRERVAREGAGEARTQDEASKATDQDTSEQQVPEEK